MNLNLRKISKERITNFQKSTGHTINTKKLSHMFADKNTLDLTKAKSAMERIVAERITIDPMKQSRGETSQLNKLNNLFGNVSKLQQGSTFIHKGKLYTQETVPEGVRTDLDAILKDKDITVGFTLKTTRSNSYAGGGSQNNSFDQVLDIIKEAPKKSDKGNLWIAAYLSGSFWSEKRTTYKTFSIDGETTCSDILKRYTKNRKCVIFGDEDLPKKKTIIKSFIKDLN